jgi:hypothetical protein
MQNQDLQNPEVLPLDEVRSQQISKTIKKAKGAFEYAMAAAIELEADHPEVLYVQGFVVFAGSQPAEHAWVELKSCRIDPNLRFLKRTNQALFYFPAQSLTVEDLKERIEEAKEDYPEDDPLPIYGKMPYEYYGDVMLGDKPYQDAYEAAKAKGRLLNRPAGPVKRSPRPASDSGESVK